ncbi:hypothetical protein D0Y65_028098, partial [Glycine soja]
SSLTSPTSSEINRNHTTSSLNSPNPAPQFSVICYTCSSHICICTPPLSSISHI